MATKIFCDCCGREITENQPKQVCIPIQTDGTLVSKAVSFRDIKGMLKLEADICFYCIVDAFNKADDRTKDQPKVCTNCKHTAPLMQVPDL